MGLNDVIGTLRIIDDDAWQPSPEEERDHWNGRGGIVFRVDQNIKDCFEMEVLDYWGCVGGMEETIGVQYYIEDIWGLTPELKEGVTYTIKGVTVDWIRGDGWEIDDDVEYDFEEIIPEWKFWPRMKTMIYNLWWQNIGWRIRTWRMKRQIK